MLFDSRVFDVFACADLFGDTSYFKQCQFFCQGYDVIIILVIQGSISFLLNKIAIFIGKGIQSGYTLMTLSY